MNTNRTTLVFASLLAFMATPAFAQQDRLPATVPSQEMMQQPAPPPAPMPPPAMAPNTPMPPMAAPMPPPPPSAAMQPALSPHPNAPLEAKQVGSITYITGGIGDAEKDQLKAEAPNYNFQMLNSDPTGHYLANIDVVISSKDGREVIRLDNTGPLFYAQLPAGEYKVEATHGMKHESRTVKVSAKGAAHADLIWK